MSVRLIILFLAWLIGWQASAWAAITFDAESHSEDTINSVTVGWNHTVGSGSDRYLLVAVQMRGTTKPNLVVTTVTCGGAPLTKIRHDSQDSPDLTYFFRVELWAMPAPSAGTCAIAVATAGVVSEFLSGSALSFFGVNQTAPVHAHTGGSGSSTGISTTVTTTTDTAWIIDAVVARGATIAAPLSVGANQTPRSVRAVGISTTEDGVGLSYVAGKTPAGNEVMDWTQSTGGDWVQSVVAVQPTTITVPAAAAVVQSCSLAAVNGGTSVSCTLPSLPSVGSTIIVPMSFGQFGTGQPTCLNGGGVTDSFGNGFDLALESPAVGRLRSYIFFKRLLSSPGGSYSITVTCPSGSWITMKAVEVSGLVPSYSAFDRAGWGSGTGVDFTGVQTFSSTSQPNELAVAVVAVEHPANAVTITPEGGWTTQYEQENCDTAGAGSVCGSAVTKLLDATGLVSHTWNFSSAVTNASAAIATFKAVNSGVGTIVRSLTWTDNATNEASFRVQKRTDATFPTWADVVSGLPPNTTAYAASLSTLETGDCWRVWAENGNGATVSNTYCPTSYTPSPPIPPPPPVLQVGGLQPLLDDELL